MPKEIYRDSFDLDTMTPSVRAEAMRQQLTEFPVWLAVILSIVTFNVFFAVYYSIKHGKLPRLVGNDPGGLAAFGLLFVPFFNVYWVFFMWTRLADRLNFQLLLAGEEPRVKRAVPIVALTLLMIGILSAGASPDLMLFIWSLNWLVLVPIFVADMQGAINVLARMRAAAQG